MDEAFVSVTDAWMKNLRNSYDPKGMQIFVSEIIYDYLSAFELHIAMLRRHFIHGQFQEGNEPYQPSRMEGFIEHCRRIPNATDANKCEVMYFNDRWLKIYTGRWCPKIISECRLNFV